MHLKFSINQTTVATEIKCFIGGETRSVEWVSVDLAIFRSSCSVVAGSTPFSTAIGGSHGRASMDRTTRYNERLGLFSPRCSPGSRSLRARRERLRRDWKYWLDRAMSTEDISGAWNYRIIEFV